MLMSELSLTEVAIRDQKDLTYQISALILRMQYCSALDKCDGRLL
jgi:hypothetical protein